MPTYEYLCHDCGLKFDHFQSMSSPAISYHTDCTMKGENVVRLISGGTGLIFKGSGFYLTDYKNNKNSKNNKKNDTKKNKKDDSTKPNSKTNKNNKKGDSNK